MSGIGPSGVLSLSFSLLGEERSLHCATHAADECATFPVDASSILFLWNGLGWGGVEWSEAVSAAGSYKTEVTTEEKQKRKHALPHALREKEGGRERGGGERERAHAVTTI